MKSKIIGIGIGIMLLATVPLAAGMTLPKSEPANLFDTTVLRGFVLFKRVVDGGKHIRFLALRVHYTTVSLNGEHSQGVLKIRPMSIPTSLKGFQSKFYMFVQFRGSVV
jgi:hypothetical protein